MDRELGRTGISVFPIGLGAMPLSLKGRPRQDRALEVIFAALDAGMNFIDTANVYCASDTEIGHNERLIQKALKVRRGTKLITVATKGGVDRRQGRVDASPRFLRKSCIESLRALKCETLTLYQLHAPDETIPLEDSVGEMLRLKTEGKILHVGLCNVTIAELRRAQKITRIESVQNECNPVNPEDYKGAMLKACERDGISFIPHSVIGGKPLCASLVKHPLLVDLGRKHGVSPFVVVVAWHLGKSNRVLPIPGASHRRSVLSSAGAAHVKHPAEDVQRIDSVRWPS